jgi:hypothetical protein
MLLTLELRPANHFTGRISHFNSLLNETIARLQLWHERNHKDRPLLTKEELEAKVHRIVQKLRSEGDLSFYIGTTRRDLAAEALRFLTARGSNQLLLKNPHKGRRNRPVLRWTDGNAIKMKQATEVLGIAYYSVYTGAWRCVAKGAKRKRSRHNADCDRQVICKCYENLVDADSRILVSALRTLCDAAPQALS